MTTGARGRPDVVALGDRAVGGDRSAHRRRRRSRRWLGIAAARGDDQDQETPHSRSESSHSRRASSALRARDDGVLILHFAKYSPVMSATSRELARYTLVRAPSALVSRNGFASLVP